MGRPLNSIDQMVGKALRTLRVDRSLTVDQLAEALRIEPPLLLSMEAGAERVPAQLLMRASIRFDVPISIFYE